MKINLLLLYGISITLVVMFKLSNVMYGFKVVRLRAEKPFCKDLRWRYFRNEKSETDVHKSSYDISIQPPGKASSIMITTINRANKRKSTGGDFWWVRVFGPVSFVVPVIDMRNGSYICHFTMREEGTYRISLVLEFSNCDGERDPPLDFFKKGSEHGMFQNEEELGNGSLLISEEKTFEVNVSYLDKYNSECVINRARGYWKGNRFVATSTFRLNTQTSTTASTRPTLWFYGDSLQRLLYIQFLTRPLCTEMFECRNTYCWMYPLVNNSKDSPNLADNKDFDKERFLNSIEKVLEHPEMKRNESVLLINFGAHLVKTLAMDTCKQLFQDFLDLVRTRLLDGKEVARVIWKTTTLPNIKKDFRRRFLTKQRVMIWNEYCMKEACDVEVPILDVFWITASFPDGPGDGIHYPEHVFNEVYNDLYAYLK